MSESHKNIDHRPPLTIKGSKQSIETIERKVKAVIKDLGRLKLFLMEK